MKKITKKNSTEFCKKATAMVVELGAIPTGKDFGYNYEIDTIAGNLKMWIRDDNNYCYTVYTKFDKPEIAIDKIAGSNPYSGKWNFHISKIPIDNAVEIIKGQIKLILKPETNGKK